MGVKGDRDLNFVLPNRINFDKCSKMFTGHDLFLNMPASPCIDDIDGDGVEDSLDQCNDSEYWTDIPVDQNGCQNQQPSTPKPVGPTAAPTSTPVGSPTAAPIGAPVASPVSTPTTSTTIDIIGECSATNKCGLCQGDCDNDSQCEPGLVCAQRGGVERIPGCNGEGGNTDVSGKDVGIKPQNVAQNVINYIGECGSQGYLCGHCEGDCDRNENCESGLVCVGRGGFEAVSGCIGEGGATDVYAKDICVDLSVPPVGSPVSAPVTSPPTALPVTTSPTANPTASPTESPTKAPVKAPIETPTASPTLPPTIIPTATRSPTQVNTSIPNILYEAEDPNNLLSSDSVVTSSVSGFTGTGFVNMGDVDSFVEFSNVDFGGGGLCKLNFHYAVKKSTNSGGSPRPCAVTIDSVNFGTATFYYTGTEWDDWGFEMMIMNCPAGVKNVRLTALTENQAPNLDNMEVSPLGLSNADHYEAEDPTNIQSGMTFSSNVAGFTGTGYLTGPKDSFLEFTNVNFHSGGTCILRFHHSVKPSSGAPRPCSLDIDGVYAGKLDFKATGPKWFNWGDDYFAFNCPVGVANVRVTATSSNGSPLIDNMILYVTSIPTSLAPSSTPTSAQTSSKPSVVPSMVPSASPSAVPSLVPIAIPSLIPSDSPLVVPSLVPSAVPSMEPSESPICRIDGLPDTVYSFYVKQVAACFRLQLYPGGFLEADFTDATCLKNAVDFNPMREFSVYDKVNDTNDVVLYKEGTEGYSGTFVFEESSSVTKTKAALMGFNGVTKVFAVKLLIPSCTV